MKTVIEIAREAGWPDSLIAPVIMAKLAEFAELVRADERARMAEQPAQQEPMDEIRCPECGYLTKHTEHIGCLRNQLNAINAFEQRNFAIVNMDTPPQPAQRTWVGLTDEDVRQCSRDVVAGGKENSVDRFAYAIESKLKEKNT